MRYHPVELDEEELLRVRLMDAYKNMNPKKVKLVQTDNGSEFQRKFVGYLTRLGIKHQYTWIHTPDQNGCVERSHRTDEEEFYQETGRMG